MACARPFYSFTKKVFYKGDLSGLRVLVDLPEALELLLLFFRKKEGTEKNGKYFAALNYFTPDFYCMIRVQSLKLGDWSGTGITGQFAVSHRIPAVPGFWFSVAGRAC